MIADKGHGQQSGSEDQVERLVAALCERLAEVLPRGKFDVTVEHRHAVRILGIGSRHGDTVVLSPMPLWRSQSPVEHRLQLFLDAASRQVQKFVSGRHRRWPTVTAKPKVSIEDDRILVWWGGESEDDAAVSLRPILRNEIGV
jgi:hypothetical protein